MMESPKTRKTHKPPDNVQMSPLMKWLKPAKNRVEDAKGTESANEIIINKSGDRGAINTQKTIKERDDDEEKEQCKVLEGADVEGIGRFRKEKRVCVDKNAGCVRESGRIIVENGKKKRTLGRVEESATTKNNENEKNLLNQENIGEFNNNISLDNKRVLSGNGKESVSRIIPHLKTGKRLKNIKTVLLEESSSGNVRGKGKCSPKTSSNYGEKITTWLIPSPKVAPTKENKKPRATEQSDVKISKKSEGILKRDKKFLETGDEKRKDSSAEKKRKKRDSRGKNDEFQRKMVEFYGGGCVLKKDEKPETKTCPSTSKRRAGADFSSSSIRSYSSELAQSKKTETVKRREDTGVKSSREESLLKMGRRCDEKERKIVTKEDGKLPKVKSNKDVVLKENSSDERKRERTKKQESKVRNNSSEKRKTNRENNSSEKCEKRGGKKCHEIKGEGILSENRETIKKKNKSSSSSEGSLKPTNPNNISCGKRKSFTTDEKANGKKTKTTDKTKTVRRTKMVNGRKPESFKSPLDNFINEGIKAKADASENRRYSYEKYGIHLPSFSEIKKLKEQLETYSDKVNRAVDYVASTSVTKELKQIEMAPEAGEVLGCESLTAVEIERYFELFLPHLVAVVRGTVYNWRHEEFVKNLNTCGNVENLAYCTTRGVFTGWQKDQLAELCGGYFDKFPIEKKTKYYFDVLLPELYLRIFMDVHVMSRRDAVNYLAKRPIEDVT